VKIWRLRGEGYGKIKNKQRHVRRQERPQEIVTREDGRLEETYAISLEKLLKNIILVF